MTLGQVPLTFTDFYNYKLFVSSSRIHGGREKMTLNEDSASYDLSFRL